jgi:hypothetical protein
MSLPGLNLSLEPTAALFDSGPIQLPKDKLRELAISETKALYLAGIPEHEIKVEEVGEDDIIITKIDRENALGFHTFDSEAEYFQHIDAQQYKPTPEELGLDGSWTS